MKRMIFAGVLGLALAGCASQPRLSQEQCASADWRAIGLQDGQAGQAMTALNDEITACKEYGISPDMAAYTAGREEGLKRYCLPATVLDATVQGVGDPFVCEPFSDTLRTAFETGRETRAAVQRWQQVQAQYQQLTERRDAINQEGARLTQLYNQEPDAARRQQIGAQITELSQQRNALDAEIAEAEPIMRQEEAQYRGAVANYERVRAGLTGS
ncbi:MAG: DUF2799 domain-containing protein [Pseudomonadota bacterium]